MEPSTVVRNAGVLRNSNSRVQLQVNSFQSTCPSWLSRLAWYHAVLLPVMLHHWLTKSILEGRQEEADQEVGAEVDKGGQGYGLASHCQRKDLPHD